MGDVEKKTPGMKAGWMVMGHAQPTSQLCYCGEIGRGISIRCVCHLELFIKAIKV